MKAYSMDLRERVLLDCDSGMEVRQVAAKYRVSESWIRRLKQRRRESGEIAPQKARPAEPKWRPHTERLKQLVADQPDATLAELQQRLGLSISVPTLCRALQALKLTVKKKSSTRRSKTVPMLPKNESRGKPR
jgi:transposase